MATISLMCQGSDSDEWTPVTSPSYDDAEHLLDWLEAFLWYDSPLSVKRLRVWK